MCVCVREPLLQVYYSNFLFSMGFRREKNNNMYKRLQYTTLLLNLILQQIYFYNHYQKKLRFGLRGGAMLTGNKRNFHSNKSNSFLRNYTRATNNLDGSTKKEWIIKLL